LLNIDSLRADLIPVLTHSSAFVQCWRDRLLTYMLTAAAMRRYESFDELTSHALAYSANLHKVNLSDAYHKSLVEAWRFLHPYPDVLPALRSLREAGFTLGVLTNATPEAGCAALENGGLSELIDVSLSAGTIKTYKPDGRAYGLVTSHYGISAEEVVFVTSEGWDATGAAEFGMHVVWCNRSGAPPETLGAKPSGTIASLRELCAILAEAAVPV
jgi:2-haloacid dehalogenase